MLLAIYALAAILVVGLSIPAVLVRHARAMIGALVLAALTCVGQVAGDSLLIYPFVKWGMYSEPVPPQSFRRYLVETEGMPEHDYPFGEVFGGSPWPIQTRLDQMIDDCRCKAHDQFLDSLIDSLGVLYRRRTGRTLLRFRVDELPLHGNLPVRVRYLYSPKLHAASK